MRKTRDSIWLSDHSGGPFESMQVLRGWIAGHAAIARDLALISAF